MCVMSKWGFPYAYAIQPNPPWIFSLFSYRDVWSRFFLISPAGWKTRFEELSAALSAQQCKEPLQDPWVSLAQLGGDGKRRKETQERW